jgi:predicted Ser/Thr protein kinase
MYYLKLAGQFLPHRIDPVLNEVLKAYSYGSSAQTYKIENLQWGTIKIIVIVKKYNDKLRWIAKGHETSRDVFNKELEILKKIIHLEHVPKLFGYDIHKMVLKTLYVGESLYYDFKLPHDWREQIRTIFDDFTEPP